MNELTPTLREDVKAAIENAARRWVEAENAMQGFIDTVPTLYADVVDPETTMMTLQTFRIRRDLAFGTYQQFWVAATVAFFALVQALMVVWEHFDPTAPVVFCADGRKDTGQ